MCNINVIDCASLIQYIFKYLLIVPLMGPKRSKKNEGRSSIQAQIEVVAIEEHFRRGVDEDEVTQILRRLEIAYKQNPLSLRNSLACFVLRVCGLSSGVSKLEFNNVSESISDILQLAKDKKIDFATDSALLIKSKDPKATQYTQQVTIFISKLLTQEYQFIKEHKNNHMLDNFKEWIGILSKAISRPIRFSAIKLMQILLERQTDLFNRLISKKQSRKAFDLVKDVQSYFPLLIARIKDIDVQIRDCVHSILKDILINMQTDIVDQKTIESIFLPSFENYRQKITENSIQTLLFLAQKSKKLKKLILRFVKSNSHAIERMSLPPKKYGVTTLKLMIQLHKQDPQANILNPNHISCIFQSYSVEEYTYGLQAAIDAFYNSIYTTEEELISNHTLVVIQIMNLINNFDNKQLKKFILSQFFQNIKVPFQSIFIADDLFNILLSESYSHNGQEIELKQNQLISWIFIIQTFATYVNKYIEKYAYKYSNVSNEKIQKQRQKWVQIGQAYNANLLTNIKSIIHQKMRGDLTKHYLKLMKKIILPIGISFQTYADFMFERIVGLFQRENDPCILDEIVLIFYSLQSHNIQLLTSTLRHEPRGQRESVLICIKKIAIMKQFSIEQYISLQSVNQLIMLFNRQQNENHKKELVVGLYNIHQWWINKFLSNDEEIETYRDYNAVQIAIIRFLFSALESKHTNRKTNVYVLKCLINLLEIVCSDQFQSSELFYQISEHEISIIYKFLNEEITILNMENQSEDQQSRDFIRIMNTLSFQETNSEKQLIARIFKIFQRSTQIAKHPFSIRFITGALLAEDDKHQNGDLSTTKQNISVSLDKTPIPSIYSKQRFATKYFQKLIDREIQPQNANIFVFWQVILNIYKELGSQLKIKQQFTSKIIDIYLKKKMGKQASIVILNKATLFLIAQIDNIYQFRWFYQFNLVYIILKKLIKKVNKHSIRRVYMFLKEKPEPNDFKQDYKNLLVFMEKASKGNTVVEQAANENDQQGNNDQEEEEVHQRHMLSFQNRRETRSMSKRQADEFD